MEEPDERDASGSVSESTVTVREHLMDDSGVSVSKDRVQSSFSEDVGRGDGGDGACNGGGEDIMVEVLGSDVYFDGVCTHRTAGNLDGVSTGGEEPPSVERDGLMESEGVSMKGTSQEGVEGDERGVDVMILDHDARVDDSSAVAGHVDRDTEAAHMEKENTGSKEAMVVDNDNLVHNSSDDEALNDEEPQKVEVHSEQSKNSPTENGFGEDLMHTDGGSQEATISDGEESLEKGTGQRSVEEEQIVDAPVDLQGTGLGVSDVDAQNSGIKTSSADGSENSNSQGPDATEKDPNMLPEKGLNPEVISQSEGSDKDLSNLERDESCIVQTEHGDMGKNDRIDDQNQVSGGGELPNSKLTHEKKISGDEKLDLCVGVEVPEIAAQTLDSENLDRSTASPGVVNSDPSVVVTEHVVSTDTLSLSQPNHDAEEDVATGNDGKVLAPSIEVSAENEQNLMVPIEVRNMEPDPQSNGQGGGTCIELEKNAVMDNNLANLETVEEMEVDDKFNANQMGLHGEEEDEDLTGIEDDDDQLVSSVKLHQARYHLPSENEGDFSVSDLVWGKVRSHPWWPGQIFDPSDSSDQAMKYYKKDFYLVAYFGDRTFAWNEVSHLKPFRTHFSQEEMQSHSEAFQNSVECALEEVSRRAELGLACACTPKEAYDMIKCQIIENAGIREESSRRYGVDKSASATSFEPAKLIEYIRDLAKFPSDGSDRLELVIAKAQLTAFYRLKGYCGLPQFQFGGLPQFQFCGGLADNELDSLGIEMQSSDFVHHAAPCLDDAQASPSKENVEIRSSSYHKRKHNLKDGLYPKKKEKSLYELMGENFDNIDGENWSDARTSTLVSPSCKRRKTVEHPIDASGAPDGRKTISVAKVSGTASLKQSFKIGDCIRRVASQLTGTPPIIKPTSERFQKPDGSFDGNALHESDVFLQNFDDAQRGKVNFPSEYSSLDELLDQLQLVASDPMKEYSFLNVIVSFFTDFRDSLILRQHPGIEEALERNGGKRKAQFTSIVASPQTFEFEDMSDTYWTDRVIQNGTEVQLPRKNRKRDYQLAVAEPEKALQGSRRPYKKRHSAGNHAMTAEKVTSFVYQPSPAELVMNFSEVDSVPSEKTLNNMFRRFGPLRESETEVDREGGRARVVFKKSSDAEIAYSSAGRFSIFGPRLVNYQLSYTPSTLFKASPIPRLQDQEMHLDLSTAQFQEMQLDLSSFHDHEMQLDLSSIHDQDMQLDLSTIGYQEMESVLGPHHDQESKPNYTAHLGEMQADFSIQYDRQSDLSAMHNQELHPVFASNQETQSGQVTSQDQELHHNFTSDQLGEMQADHTLTPHRDEPPVSASDPEQNMPPVFATIKEEKTQPAITTFQEESQSVLGMIQEQETHTILDTAQLGRMQADLNPTHHERQTVPATSLEHETQPVFAMIQEGTHQVMATSQEQEDVANAGTTTVHHKEQQPVPSIPQEQDMQPVVATVRENEMVPVLTSTLDHEREPVTSEELLGEPVPATTEGQETQRFLGTMNGHEEDDALGTKEQEAQSVTPATHEEKDTQQVVLTGEEAQEETQVAPGFTEGQETQVLDSTEGQETQVLDSTEEQETQVLDSTEEQETQVLDSTEGQETEVLDTTEDQETQVLDATEGQETQVLESTEGQETQVLDSMEGHESKHDLGANEQATQSVVVADEQDDTQPLVSAGEEAQEETQSILASTQELETEPDHTSAQELEHDEEAMQGQELQPDQVTTEEEHEVPDSLTSQVQDVQSNHATELAQDLLPDVNELPRAQCDDDKNQVQVVQNSNSTNQEQEEQPGNNKNPEQEMRHDIPTNHEQEMQHYIPTDKEQEKQCDHAADKEEEKQVDNAADQVQDMQCDDVMSQEQEMQCDNPTSQDQEMKCDNAMSQDQEMQCDNSTSQEQEKQLGNATSEQEMECDSEADKEHAVQSSEAASHEQDAQSDHEQESQTNYNSTNQEQEKIPNFGTQEQDIESDVDKHPAQVQAMGPDFAAVPDSDTHTDSVPTKDQEMQLGISSLGKKTD